MSKLFGEKIHINPENAKVFKEIGKDAYDDGYHHLILKDCYGNVYRYRHEVVMAECSGVPKHLWPVDEFGRRYIVDHIIPVSNGGTDAFENLRLIPFRDNPKNENSKENYIKSNSRTAKKIGAFDKDGNLIKIYDKSSDVEKDGFNPGTVRSKMSKGRTVNGVLFKHI